MLNKSRFLKITAVVCIYVSIAIFAGCGGNGTDGRGSGIVGTWSFEKRDSCNFLERTEFVFNSNGTGVGFLYINNVLAYPYSFTYSLTNDTVYINEYDDSFPYSGGTTFYYYDDKFTKTSEGSCGSNNKPNRPANINVATTSSVVNLTWDFVPGAKGYFVSGGSSSDNLWTVWATSTNSISIDWGYYNDCHDRVNPNIYNAIENFFGSEISTVYLKITAVNNCGFSEQSNIISVHRP